MVFQNILVYCTHPFFFYSFFKRFYLFILERGREGGRERNINVWLPLMLPLLGTWPATHARALDRESNRWPLDLQAGPQCTEPHQPGLFFFTPDDVRWYSAYVMRRSELNDVGVVTVLGYYKGYLYTSTARWGQ